MKFPSKSSPLQHQSKDVLNEKCSNKRNKFLTFNFLSCELSRLWILGRIDARRVDSQRRHSLQIYLSLNLWICLERWNRLHRHAELCASRLKLLVAVGIAVVRHWRRCECLLEFLLRFGWLRLRRLLGESWWLLHWIIVELVHVVHWDVVDGRSWWRHWKEI